MRSRTTTWLTGLLLAGLLGTTAAVAGDRTAEEILKDYEAVEMPDFDQDRQEDEAYIKEYLDARRAAMEEQAELILELFETHPDHERLEALMPRRWDSLYGRHPEVIKAEIDAVIKKAPDGPLATEGRYVIAAADVQKAVWAEEPDVEAAEKAAAAFIDAVPDDDRGARLLGMIAGACEAGSKKQIAMLKRIRKDYPDSIAAKYADGQIRQATSVGEPFELAFTDAITGTEISMADLRGQVVVLDFWATWCGPCVAEMPHMKELYAEYHPQGVQFIGVSLDNSEEQGGLEALKEYVADNEIPWPQYYQGNGWDSEFSVSWGINSIPALFIVDKEGNLHSTEARGELEELIPKLLAE